MAMTHGTGLNGGTAGTPINKVKMPGKESIGP